MHSDCEPIAFLLGTWRGEGEGGYSTIDDFAYTEEITFDQVGKPFLSYMQRTRDATSGLPLHSESGYWRPVGDGRLEVVIAQPSGIAEILEGTVVDGAIDLTTTGVGRTGTAKAIAGVQRSVRVEGDSMSYELHMAAVGETMSYHLSARLQRVS